MLSQQLLTDSQPCRACQQKMVSDVKLSPLGGRDLRARDVIVDLELNQISAVDRRLISHMTRISSSILVST